MESATIDGRSRGRAKFTDLEEKITFLWYEWCEYNYPSLSRVSRFKQAANKGFVSHPWKSLENHYKRNIKERWNYYNRRYASDITFLRDHHGHYKPEDFLDFLNDSSRMKEGLTSEEELFNRSPKRSNSVKKSSSLSRGLEDGEIVEEFEGSSGENELLDEIEEVEDECAEEKAEDLKPELAIENPEDRDEADGGENGLIDRFKATAWRKTTRCEYGADHSADDQRVFLDVDKLKLLLKLGDHLQNIDCTIVKWLRELYEKYGLAYDVALSVLERYGGHRLLVKEVLEKNFEKRESSEDQETKFGEVIREQTAASYPYFTYTTTSAAQLGDSSTHTE